MCRMPDGGESCGEYGCPEQTSSAARYGDGNVYCSKRVEGVDVSIPVEKCAGTIATGWSCHLSTLIEAMARIRPFFA